MRPARHPEPLGSPDDRLPLKSEIDFRFQRGIIVDMTTLTEFYSDQEALSRAAYLCSDDARREALEKKKSLPERLQKLLLDEKPSPALPRNIEFRLSIAVAIMLAYIEKNGMPDDPIALRLEACERAKQLCKSC